ncbi:hypothetical protein [Chitinivorax sp. B]|uniref:hypothetical protein n=1 Tax=Chitinivorax sp. B TaxID=2502235 RepID=UPI0010F4DA9E|nr:hypothetical protein [Chitinivorax sp. B]
MNQNPYMPPQSDLDAADEANLMEVASAQRMLLISIVISLICNVTINARPAMDAVVGVVAIGNLVFSLWSIFRLCKALDRQPILWMIAMFIPLVNLIALLFLNRQATSHLKDAGYDVGLFGAK